MHHVYVGYVSGVRDGAPGLGNVVLPGVSRFRYKYRTQIIIIPEAKGGEKRKKQEKKQKC